MQTYNIISQLLGLQISSNIWAKTWS